MKEYINSEHYSTVPPKFVGGYRLGKPTNLSVKFNLTYRPNWFHRTMMRVCLDFYWIDDTF
jgi:hypothetical protein